MPRITDQKGVDRIAHSRNRPGIAGGGAGCLGTVLKGAIVLSLPWLPLVGQAVSYLGSARSLQPSCCGGFLFLLMKRSQVVSPKNAT